MSWGNSLDLQVLGSVSSQLKHLGGQVLENGGAVNGSGGSDSLGSADSLFEKSVDSSNWELYIESINTQPCVLFTYLKSCSDGPALRSFLALSGTNFASFSTFSSFASGLYSKS